MWGLPQKQNARRAYKIRLCGHLRRYKKIVKKTYIILYNDLSKIIINLLSEINHTEKIDNSRLNSYIVENYSKMCLTFEPSLIWDISTLNEECKLSKENTVYYCEKILKRIRKEIGINQTFHINKKAISYISNSYKEVVE